MTKQVLSMADDAIYVVDNNMKIVAANEIIEKWSKKNGFTESIAGKNIEDALPFINEQAISDIKDVLHSAKPLKAEYTWPLDQNSIVMAHILPLYTQDDNIQVITIAHNLGEKTRIIEGIIKRELAARLLLEQATDGIHIYTIDGVLLYANEALISRLGYTLDEFMNLQPAEIDLSADKKRFPQFLQEMLSKKHILYETVFITKDNQKLSTEVNGTVVDYFGEKTIL
ncbi:MAG: PAS domain S-box protein, partial [Candidatus Thorarchaeota archaeon]|nr:PAS domain S-box protein [Candidatus Thorarchaeota archaeon]